MRCLTIVSQRQKRSKSTQIADDYSRLFQNLPVKFPLPLLQLSSNCIAKHRETLHCTEGWEGKATSNKANKKNAAEAIFY